MDERIDKDKTLGWIKNGELKACTKTQICVAQEQTQRTKYENKNLYNTRFTSMYVMWIKGETIGQIASEFKMPVQRENKRKHDSIARSIHWDSCGELNLERANK